MTQVNTRAAHVASVQRMSELSAQVDALQGQMSTTKRVSLPGDDPIAYTRAAMLRRADIASAATQRGIDAASRRLTATDTALESITNLVQRARELALLGSTGTMSPQDSANLATEVAEIQKQFAGLAESRGSDGERLFGGAAADRPAYAVDTNGIITWQGAGTAPSLDVGGAALATGIEGPDAFGRNDAATGAEDLFATFASLAKALVTTDPAVRLPALEAALNQIDGHVTRLADSRATAGARLARLDMEGVRIDKTTLATRGDLSKLEDLDMAEAIARMQRLITVLEATQGAFVKVSNISLWDLLR